MTPTTRPPAARAAAETAPISPTRPPPNTSVIPRRARASPIARAVSPRRGRLPAFAPQKTQSDFTVLEPAGREPPVELIEPVDPPERLAVDDDVRRAERADRDRLVDLGLGPVLHRLIGERGANLVGGDPERRRDRDRVLGDGGVDVLEEVGGVERLRELLRPLRVLLVQPVERAGGRDRGDRKGRRVPIGHAVKARAAQEV